jgi:hypothetical protein
VDGETSIASPSIALSMDDRRFCAVSFTPSTISLNLWKEIKNILLARGKY